MGGAGLSEEPVQQDREAVGSGGGGGGSWEMMAAAAAPTHHQYRHLDHGKKQRQQQQQQRQKKGAWRKERSAAAELSNNSNNQVHVEDDDGENDQEDIDQDEEEEMNGGGGGGMSYGGMMMMMSSERQREHPFIVTEPGEVARGKKNGLDYLFHLYELCRDYLLQVQNLAKERGEKCPTKVTNQVFRYAKTAGATYINKPKMRHYVHCYALHCLDEETSNALRRAFKERGENVGAWRQACYKPLVAIAARQGWDIDAIFNAHPRLSIWYVPTKLRQLCHAEHSVAATASHVSSVSAAAASITNHHHHLSSF
ncbi:hypothetical protein Dimus_036272 [Dionaea muscipula]